MTPGGKSRVPMTVTFFEMTAKPSALPPPQPKGRHAILKAENPSPEFYRFLYVLYVEGCPAGMAELDLRKDGVANISYFGLMPDFIGKRLGYFFLYHACQNAWAHPISRLTINTCTLDHPRALPLYQRIGFTAYAREERFVELP